MNCPKCKHAQADGSTECENCQVIFAKLLKPAPAQPPAPPQIAQAPPVAAVASTANVLGLLLTIFKYALLTLLSFLVYGFFNYQKWKEEEFHRRRKENANRGAAQQEALRQQYRFR